MSRSKGHKNPHHSHRRAGARVPNPQAGTNSDPALFHATQNQSYKMARGFMAGNNASNNNNNPSGARADEHIRYRARLMAEGEYPQAGSPAGGEVVEADHSSGVPTWQPHNPDPHYGGPDVGSAPSYEDQQPTTIQEHVERENLRYPWRGSDASLDPVAASSGEQSLESSCVLAEPLENSYDVLRGIGEKFAPESEDGYEQILFVELDEDDLMMDIDAVEDDGPVASGSHGQ